MTYTPRAVTRRPRPHTFYTLNGRDCTQCALPHRNRIHDVPQPSILNPELTTA